MKLIALLALAAGSTALAAPIQVVESLPQTDRAKIDAVENMLFDQIAKIGAEQAVELAFSAIGAPGIFTPELRRTFREVDQKCGKPTGVERIGTQSFGTYVVRDTFVAEHGECLLKWVVTYVSYKGAWRFNRVSFVTYEGNEW
jgi:hypothetical protein